VIFFLQILVSGLATGSIYGLVAVGYSVTYTTMSVLNFGLGMWVMLGAMLGLTAYTFWGLNIVFTVAVVVAVVYALAALMERVTVHPFVMAGSSVWIMSTLAVGMLMLNGAQLIWGRDPLRFPSVVGESSIRMFGLGIYPQELLIIVAAVLIMLLLDVFYQRTLRGKALRATAFSFDTAALMGINTDHIARLSFGLSGCLAAVAGILIAPVTTAEATMGTVLGIKAFGIAVIGGLESPKGIFLCGILYGILEGLLSGYLFTGIRDIVGFSLVICLLYFKPEGLFGIKSVEKL